MSDKRRPVRVIKDYLPSKRGKKQAKIELFAASDFANQWSYGDKRFKPTPPTRNAARFIFWSTRYRVRLNDKWYGDKQYHFFTMTEILYKLLL